MSYISPLYLTESPEVRQFAARKLLASRKLEFTKKKDKRAALASKKHQRRPDKNTEKADMPSLI